MELYCLCLYDNELQYIISLFTTFEKAYEYMKNMSIDLCRKYNNEEQNLISSIYLYMEKFFIHPITTDKNKIYMTEEKDSIGHKIIFNVFQTISEEFITENQLL